MLLKELFRGRLPQAIIFDLDGTLVDSVQDIHHGLCSMLHGLGLPVVDITHTRQWIGNGSFKLVQRALAFFQSSAHKSIVSRIDMTSAHTAFLNDYAATGHQHSVLYPGVAEVLAHFQAESINMALVTNKPSRFTAGLLRQLGIEQYFDPVFSGDSLADKKPSPLPLMTVSQHLHIALSDCLMVGDSINDIEAAKACGMKSIMVTYGYHQGVDMDALGADVRIDEFAELMR